MHLLQRQQEELRAAHQRTMQLESDKAQLENDNVQMQARVSGEAGKQFVCWFVLCGML